MLLLATLASFALGAEPASAAYYPPGHQLSFGLPLAAGYTAAGVLPGAGISSHLYLGFRPSLTWSPSGLRNFGVGVYAEAATLRTFKDLHVALGVEVAAPGELWLRPVLSGGGFVNLDSRGWAPGLEVGIFYGIHGSYTGPTGTVGLRFTGRYRFGSPAWWLATIALELDGVWVVSGINRLFWS